MKNKLAVAVNESLSINNTAILLGIKAGLMYSIFFCKSLNLNFVKSINYSLSGKVKYADFLTNK